MENNSCKMITRNTLINLFIFVLIFTMLPDRSFAESAPDVILTNAAMEAESKTFDKDNSIISER